MDLKDVINIVLEKAPEAHSAYHAGHHDVAENYLDEIRMKVAEYFDLQVTLRNVVNGSATSEKPEETSQETPAQGPEAAAHPGGIVPFDETQKQQPASQSETPTL